MTSHSLVTFSNMKMPAKGLLVLFAEEGPRLTQAGREIDKRSGNLLTKGAQLSGFRGQRHSSIKLLAPAGLDYAGIILVGIGDAETFETDDWLNLGGFVRGLLAGNESKVVSVALETPKGSIKPDDIAAFGRGVLLRDYKFEKYKTVRTRNKNANGIAKPKVSRITIRCDSPRTAEKAFTSDRAVASGVGLARDLVNEPANKLGPLEFVEVAKSLAARGVKIQVLDEKKLTEYSMNALLAVGQGSERPSRVVIMRWFGEGLESGQPVVIVGKGVCFDTGGLSMKTSAGMESMKGDMAGAACVVGLMQALADCKAKVNVIGIIGLVENMTSGNAMRPGDVITSMSGQTIEVLNTDAEGRMVLADCLWYAQKHLRPAALIDLATLTGAVMVALGKDHAGLFSNNDDLAEQLLSSGATTGERLWRLPLDPKYDKMIESKIADMKNIGGGGAGSISAAQFLQRFVKKETPWAHLDIAGTAFDVPDSEINHSWGSGYGVQLLYDFLRRNFESKSLN